MHIPNYINPDGKSGSSIRPIKMLQAFKNCGYDVSCVMGYGRERKKQIEQIKKNILAGEKYDFLYSESSTMPTLLTEKDHIPRCPFLDFGFLKFCRSHGIRTGLFYRDIQWKFPLYRDNVVWYKKCFSIPLYYYDLYEYIKCVDVFYLPTTEMKKYIGIKKLTDKTRILMPGAETDNALCGSEPTYDFEKKKLSVLYVGGIDRIYDLTEFLAAVKKMRREVKAVVCCREKEWKGCRERYLPYLGENIEVVHESGEGLESYYSSADLCCAFAGKGEYMSMAMPVKIFEYLGHLIPILATEGTAAGKFVKENDIGWSIEYNENAMRCCLEKIRENPLVLYEKRNSEKKILQDHTWLARAKQVIRDLTLS